MKGKRFKGIVIVALTVVIGLCVCGKDKVNVENTSGYEQMESTTGEGVYDSTSDGARESSGDADAETIETAKTEESTEAVKESSESTKESVKPSKEETKTSKEQESSTPFKAQENTQQTTGKEKTKPSQEESKPSVSVPSAEQTAPSKEETKPSVSTPTVEQPKPSAPQVHTCDYGSGTVTKEATCKEEGVRTFTCSCGASKTESIAKTGHNYVTDSKAATCTEAGYEKTACSSCGDVKSESTTPATGHSMEEHWFPSGPTCVTDGGMHFEKCTKCGVTNDLPPGQPLGHSPDEGTVINAADCTSQSLIEHYCTRCGAKLDYTHGPIDPNNHYWCYDKEEQIEYCAGCGITR